MLPPPRVYEIAVKFNEAILHDYMDMRELGSCTGTALYFLHLELSELLIEIHVTISMLVWLNEVCMVSALDWHSFFWVRLPEMLNDLVDNILQLVTGKK